MSQSHYIQVFEHSTLKVDDVLEDVRTREQIRFTEQHRKALETFYAGSTPFFSLIHRGVKFNEHVGVLQTGNLTIEVLPKADKDETDKASWQKFLITMLRAAGIFPETTGTAQLKLRNHSILDLYMQLFLQEVRFLMHTGLVRKYRKTEGNTTALKGSLQFAKNIRQNLTHAERFFVRHTVYDRNNRFNAILRKTVSLIQSITNRPDTAASAAALLLDFPECDDLRVSEALFNKLHFDRKTESYRKAIAIARLLLLRYHPDVRQGAHEVLALMFDMNALWEKYVFRKLKRCLTSDHPGIYEVSEQVRTDFWRPEGGYMRIVKPDIVIRDTAQNKTTAVLDTKWKRLTNNRPDDADLKQMLVYNLYRNTTKSSLVYPSRSSSAEIKGTYEKGWGSCSLITLELTDDGRTGKNLNVSFLSDFIRNQTS